MRNTEINNKNNNNNAVTSHKHHELCPTTPQTEICSVCPTSALMELVGLAKIKHKPKNLKNGGRKM